MDYVKFCRNYFALTNIPVTLMDGQLPVFSALGEMLDLELHKPQQVFWETGDVKTNPSFARYSPEIEYGCLHVEGTAFYIILGPVFSVPITNEIVNTYLRENQIGFQHRETVSDFLHAIPLTSQQQFCRHLVSLHMSLNGADIDLSDMHSHQAMEQAPRQGKLTQKMLADMDEGQLSNSYDYERLLYRVIQGGDIEVLDEFLKNHAGNIPEGVLASSPLRHEKNLLIRTVTKVGQFAGIPAGIGVDRVYMLTELYIQECEKLQSIGDVKALSYAMMRDFCQRCGEAKLPSGLSKEVYQCLRYIHSHLTEQISISDLVAHTGKSSSYLTRKFREEMGMSIGTCITGYKLDRAKELLTYNDKTLAEISFILGFSSQSHFQNTFKKAFGITPMQYRKDSQKR